jgi:hypothetical protein
MIDLVVVMFWGGVLLSVTFIPLLMLHCRRTRADTGASNEEE